MHDTILFDFFGVICDDPQHLLLRRHPHLEPAVARAAYLLDTGRIPYDTYLAYLARISDECVTDLTRAFTSPHLLNKAVVRLIATLKQNARIGLLSNTCTEEFNRIASMHTVRELFDEIIISSETGLAKPDPAIFNLALQRLGARAETTVFIDDNEVNVIAARHMGLRAIQFTDKDQLSVVLKSIMAGTAGLY